MSALHASLIMFEYQSVRSWIGSPMNGMPPPWPAVFVSEGAGSAGAWAGVALAPRWPASQRAKPIRPSASGTSTARGTGRGLNWSSLNRWATRVWRLRDAAIASSTATGG